ncbi:type II toxin-antitoxin system RelE/ParE family toxin [Phytobacter sp. V91]|uniref:type II toxin-antitoxin system RelE/ParE family toxin n=1 Tax=Phytobacter sp. V91 TaxID=3369425 RepID=UPI003F639C1D
MIRSFRHKGLRDLFLNGTERGVKVEHIQRLRRRLAVIHASSHLNDIDLPGYRLHPLGGARQGIWAITVSANWRLTFEFSDGDAWILDYEDYH